MDYFFSKIGRGFRYSATIIGSLAIGAVIILGILGIQTIVIPICGGIALIPMAMVLFESTKILRDMEKLITKFKTDLGELRKINTDLSQNVLNLGNEVDQLKITKEKLIEETTKLENLLNEAEIKVTKLGELSNNYEASLKVLMNEINITEQNNHSLQQNVDSLLKIKAEYESEINNLKNNIDLIEVKINELSKIRDDYSKQIQEFAANNSELFETTEALKNEISRVNRSYEEAKDVIKTLLRSKDLLNDIYNSMLTTEQRTEENVSTVTKLLNIFKVNRSEELFAKLDKDNDKILTLEEFTSGILDSQN